MRKSLGAYFLAFLVFLLNAEALSEDKALAVSAMDEEARFYYERYLTNPAIGLLLPVEAEILGEEDTENFAVSVFALPQFESSIFAFFAIRNPDMVGVDLMNASQREKYALFAFISQIPEGLEPEEPFVVFEDIPALRVAEGGRGNSYCEHLLAIHGEWVLNMMIQRLDDQMSFTAEEKEEQNSILRGALGTRGRRKTSYALPESDIAITVPGNMHLTLAEDEPEMKWILAPRPDTRRGGIMILLLRNEDYLGHSVTTLDEESLRELMIQPALREVDFGGQQLLEDFVGDIPVLAYTEKPDPANPLSFSHMLAVRGDWAVFVSYMRLETDGSEWEAEAQEAFMRQILGEAAEIPNVAKVPSTGR